MIPLRILTLIITEPTHPSIVVLQPIEESPPGKTRIVPIWVGFNEAHQVALAVEGARLARPTTHDLFLDALTNLDTRIERILIKGTHGQTFFAQLVLRQGDRLIELDARPSDALALAARQDAPLFIDEETLDLCSFPYLFKQTKSARMELDEFHTFLEHLSPDDFDL